MDNPNLKLALLLASRGVKVFPCREKKGAKRNKKGEFPKEKAPYTINGFHDAATDELSIYRWWKQWPNAIVGMPSHYFRI